LTNKNKNKKALKLQLFCNHLQSANNSNKEYEENSGVGFVRSGEVGHVSNPK